MSIADFEKAMMDATDKGATVHVIDVDDKEYEGEAFGFTYGHDEEDGYATFCIRDPKVSICLGSNELKSLEVVA